MILIAFLLSLCAAALLIGGLCAVVSGEGRPGEPPANPASRVDAGLI